MRRKMSDALSPDMPRLAGNKLIEFVINFDCFILISAISYLNTSR